MNKYVFAVLTLVSTLASAEEILVKTMGPQDVDLNLFTMVMPRSTGKCLSVSGDASGNPVLQADCQNAKTQNWEFRKSRPGFVTIHPKHTEQCLDATGGENGSPVIQRNCSDGASQNWRLEKVGESYYFINKQANRCLDATGADNGSPVVLWDCWGANNQKWYIPDIPEPDRASQVAIEVLGGLNGLNLGAGGKMHY